MDSAVNTEKLQIRGMTCAHCRDKIERKLRDTAGVKKAEVSHGSGTAIVTYDAGIVSLRNITAAIEKLGYLVLTANDERKPEIRRVIGLLIIIAALYVLLEQYGFLNLLAPGRLADTKMGYGMLFVIGLVTSVHCIAMCGGLNLSQCMPRGNEIKGGGLSAFLPAFQYNAGRVVSYTAIGFAVGALGAAITFSSSIEGVLKLVAGVFMVIMGINLLGVSPQLRRLNPGMPQIFAQKINREKVQGKSPWIVGLLNGFMPCGPLQAMQIYALSTGNPFTGALSMFLFSMGSVPLMFGLGAFSSLMGRKFTSQVMTVGAVLIVVLGLSMLSRGLSLSGFANAPHGWMPDSRYDAQVIPGIVMENDAQIVNSTLSPWSYPAITVRAGTPVKWTVDAPEGSINGCNNRIFIREYGIEHTFSTGENIIEFMPENAGTFRYACWMGMIRSSITVIEKTDGKNSQ